MTLQSPQDNADFDQQNSNDSQNADEGLAEDLVALTGVNPDGTAYIDPEDADQLEDITTTDVYQGETTSTQERTEPAEDYDLLLESDLREGETTDVMEAVEEGLSYIPSIDPPTTSDTDDPEGLAVATGFGLTAEDELGAGDLETLDAVGDDLSLRVRRALRDDSMTQHLARRLRIAADDGRVIITGEVDDLTDSDNILTLLEEVPGVEEAVDQTTVRGL